ncbi:MAG: hypothetical protein PHG20_12725 [Geobacteraceae bacterium]|nr:hypothetical protein [Geobacteraceae bacterium]
MKQNILEKGAIMQRDGETFAVKVHMPGGYTDAQELRRIADTAERQLSRKQATASLGLAYLFPPLSYGGA